jgi:hypothetical protein
MPGTQKNAEPNSSPQKPPEASPKGPQLAPVQHAVAGGVVADDVLFRVEVLADDRQLLHVEAVLLKLADGVFSLVVRSKYRDDGVRFGLHLVPRLSFRYTVTAIRSAIPFLA